jgi:hypothetical protein
MIRKGTKVEFKLWLFKNGKEATFVGKVLEKDEDSVLVWAVEKGKRKGYRECWVNVAEVAKATPEAKTTPKAKKKNPNL